MPGRGERSCIGKARVVREALEEVGDMSPEIGKTMGDPTQCHRLISRMKICSTMVRRRSRTCLRGRGDTGHSDSLKIMISDENSENIRIRAVIKLGNDRSREAKNMLINTLSTLNSFVRDAAVQSLVRIDDVDFLCNNITHEHRYVRRGIVQALGELGGTKACKTLVKALKDQEWGVRMYAAESLGKVGDKNHLVAIQDLVGDEHIWASQVAESSLKKLSDNSSGKSYH